MPPGGLDASPTRRHGP